MWTASIYNRKMRYNFLEKLVTQKQCILNLCNGHVYCIAVSRVKEKIKWRSHERHTHRRCVDSFTIRSGRLHPVSGIRWCRKKRTIAFHQREASLLIHASVETVVAVITRERAQRAERVLSYLKGQSQLVKGRPIHSNDCGKNIRYAS